MKENVFSSTSPRSRLEAGFSLIEAMLSVGILSFILMSVAVYVGSAMREVESGASFDQIKAFQEKLVATIQNDESWRRSMSDTQRNRAMQCMANPRTICRAQAFNPNTNPPLAIYNPSGLDDEVQYNQYGQILNPATAGPIYDATFSSGGLFNGITASGKKCFGFSPRISTPNCPLRFNLRWYSLTSTSSPLIAVYGLLQVSPNTVAGINPNHFSIGQIDANGRLVNPIIRKAQ